MQREVRLVEPRHLLHRGRADQPAVDRVGPRVVAALDRLPEMSRLLGAEPRAPVATDVEESVQDSRAVPEDDDRLAGDLPNDEVARLREARGAPHAVPAPREDPLAFLREDRLRHVPLARHRPSARLVAGRGAVERGHTPSYRRRSPRIRCAASHPAPPSTPGPGWLPAPPKYKPGIGVVCPPHPATGLMKRI